MQLHLTKRSAGRLMIGALALSVLAPTWLKANVGAAIHVPSGRIYVQTGTQSSDELRAMAIQACGQKELNGDRARANQCAPVKNFASGPCDSKYARGNQFITVGGYHLVPPKGTVMPANFTPPNSYTGFMQCGKSQKEADEGFEQHCAGPACSIWEHYTDTTNVP